MVSKHTIEKVVTWYKRGYDVPLIAQALAIIESHLKGNK